MIPQGFKAVNIGAGVWSYKDTEKTVVEGWNEGLVIEDVYNGNQFVWVPVDGEKVNYEKKFGFPGVYTATEENTFDDFNAVPVENQMTQIDCYGGFYVARFEAGNAQAINSIDDETVDFPNNNTGTVPVSHKGEKIWNCIAYDNAVVVSKLMVNDRDKYGNTKSGLITGTRVGYNIDMVSKRRN